MLLEKEVQREKLDHQELMGPSAKMAQRVIPDCRDSLEKMPNLDDQGKRVIVGSLALQEEKAYQETRAAPVFLEGMERRAMEDFLAYRD